MDDGHQRNARSTSGKGTPRVSRKRMARNWKSQRKVRKERNAALATVADRIYADARKITKRRRAKAKDSAEKDPPKKHAYLDGFKEKPERTPQLEKNAELQRTPQNEKNAEPQRTPQNEKNAEPQRTPQIEKNAEMYGKKKKEVRTAETPSREKKEEGLPYKRRGSRWPSRERMARRPSQEKLSREGGPDRTLDVDDENKQEVPTDAQRAAFERFAKVRFQPIYNTNSDRSLASKEVFAMGIDGLLREFKEGLRPYVANPYKREAFDLHMDKNRYRDVTCNDFTRVVLNDGKGSDYIHANYIRGAPLVCTFICTQGPLPETIIDFWRMVWLEKVSHIIMLCGVKEEGKVKCEQYWPDENGEKMTLEDFLIKTMKVNNSDPHVTRTTIQLQQGSERHYLKHHRWKTWPDRNVPKSLLAVFRILHQVRSSKSPIVVHCSAGIGRTGSLVAIEMGLQCLLAGTTLNLLKICKRLRDQRMHSVQVEIQYVYVAEALCEYGRAMKYIENQKLLHDFERFKISFNEYVAGLDDDRPAQSPCIPCQTQMFD
ncbi:hypothetical protein Y032_0094g2728 [Ancylostoma ceylanicum]|uniref:Protein-tyrosine phosphatase n=1 Tax=Ancylostoma ceylanicum TaxID=53326 RepID=A0A016TLC6_9BILA|nr:hypothetical protein Y032_0094g2728 [Ancylostoma ceylanicum]